MDKSRTSPLVGYQHQPFKDNNSIRLLYLQPGHFDDKINIKLCEVSISDAPDYEALSYAWDSPVKGSPVYCSGKVILVTENYVAALRRLRNKKKLRILWIDAICIDQTSLEERNHQVQLMGDVYSGAKLVVIWLGESDDDSEFMMKFLIRYGAIIHGPPVKKYYTFSWKARLLKKLRARETLLGIQPGDLNILDCITKRSWFERVWVVQEFVLSRAAIFQVGDRDANAYWLLSALRNFSTLAISSQVSSLGLSTFPSVIYPYLELYCWIQSRPLEQTDFNAMELLVCIRNHFATDPRDIMFGVYGLLQRLGVKVPQVEYSKSTEEIFTEATKAAIEHQRELSILIETGMSPGFSRLPSWVPDWSVKKTHCLSPSLGYLHWDPFKATKDSSALFRFLPGTMLSVTGIVIDIVSRSQSHPFPGENSAGAKDSKWSIIANRELDAKEILTFEVISSWIDAILVLGSDPYSTTGETLEDVFLRVLNFDYDEWSWNNLSRRDFICETWLQSYLLAKPHVPTDTGKQRAPIFAPDAQFQTALAHRLKCDVKDFNHNTAEYTAYSISSHKDAELYAETVHIRNQNTRLLLTEGGLMGKGLDGIAAGDMVILVAGVKMPLIARPMGDNYRLLGPCYVHGIMEGEMWPKDERELVNIVFE